MKIIRGSSGERPYFNGFSAWRLFLFHCYSRPYTGFSTISMVSLTCAGSPQMACTSQGLAPSETSRPPQSRACPRPAAPSTTAVSTTTAVRTRDSLSCSLLPVSTGIRGSDTCAPTARSAPHISRAGPPRSSQATASSDASVGRVSSHANPPTAPTRRGIPAARHCATARPRGRHPGCITVIPDSSRPTTASCPAPRSAILIWGYTRLLAGTRCGPVARGQADPGPQAALEAVRRRRIRLKGTVS
jgi:hypothetical protein